MGMSVSLAVRPLHQLPGRLRAAVPGLAGNSARAQALARRLLALPGVVAVEASVTTGRVLIRYAVGQIDAATLLALLAESAPATHVPQEGVPALAAQEVAAAAAGAVPNAVSSVATAVAGLPYVRRGLGALRRRRITGDLVTGTAAVLALGLGEAAVGFSLVALSTLCRWAARMTGEPVKEAAPLAPVALGLAGVTALLMGNPRRALTMLVAAAPAAVPLVKAGPTVAARLAAGRVGVDLGSDEALLRTGGADVVLLDEGLLTGGKARLAEVQPLQAEWAPQEILRLAAAAEADLAHPLARAISQAATHLGQRVPQGSRQQIEIHGVSAAVEHHRVWVGDSRYMEQKAHLTRRARLLARRLALQGKTSLFVAWDSTVIGVLGFTMAAPAWAREMVESLRAQGAHVGLLSAQEPAACQALARSLGLAPVIAHPDVLQRQRMIARLRARGQQVAVVTGHPRAPELIAADSSITVGYGGPDQLIVQHPNQVPGTTLLCRRTQAVVRQNTLLANGLAAAGLGFAAAGLLLPAGALLFPHIATIGLLANSARCLRSPRALRAAPLQLATAMPEVAATALASESESPPPPEAAQVRLGLSSVQAYRQLARYGPNQLQAPPKPSFWQRLLRQFKDVMVGVLLAGAAIALVSGHVRDALTIGGVLVLNATIGAWQEGKADGAMEALKSISAPMARVVRDGMIREIDGRTVVPGDLLLLETGDRIAADGEILEHSAFAVEESMLTGESTAVEKEAGLRVFAGTNVVRGRAVVQVTATGMATEMGRIATMLGTAKAGQTPLHRRMEELGRYILFGALSISALVVGIGLLRGQPFSAMLMVGISLAAAAIPEGLPTFVTLGLAAGVRQMAKRGAVVRELSAVETLGCATVICSDKTGTLTQNQMTVRQMYAGGERWEVSGSGFSPAGEFLANGRPIDPLGEASLRRLLILGTLCNNASLQEDPIHGWRVLGDMTEGALLVAASKAGIYAAELAQHQQRVAEVPFASERRRMSVVCRNTAPVGVPTEGWVEHHLTCTKGAPEAVLEACTHIYRHGKVAPLTDGDRAQILQAAQEMASGALRVLGVAYRVSLAAPAGELDTEVGLTFCGLVGMKDPPRPEIAAAVARCHRAGVKVMMLTGDHRFTAAAVAREIGLLTPQRSLVVTGSEIARWSDTELHARVEELAVCARVSPEQKLRIVRALKRRGHVVAMTGDGVNDAPAVKEADIGIAMGISGTDVTKQAAGLVLTDDNFATIVDAIEHGRSTYSNLRKAVRYLLASNLGEVVLMLATVLLGLPMPLLAIQLLWINMVGDGLPALSLIAEEPGPLVMNQPPRPRNESLFAHGLGRHTLVNGLQMGLAATGVYALALRLGKALPVARTMALVTVGVIQIAYLYRCRQELEHPDSTQAPNRLVHKAAAATAVVLLGSLYVPFIQQTFALAPLGLSDWGLVLAGAAAGVVPLSWRPSRGRPRRVVEPVVEPVVADRAPAPVIYLPPGPRLELLSAPG